MRKFIIPLLSLVLMLGIFAASAVVTTAENSSDSAIPDDAVITYGYLKEFKETLKQEILAELKTEGGITADSLYSDVTATEGQIIYLSADSEIIYRGGGASVITSSDLEGEGIKDMSEGTELFSGQPLEYGHIYYCAESESKKAVLITGSRAYFTVRGSYEIG